MIHHRRYFIRFAYHGAGYHGWQAQNNAVSIQQKLQEAMGKLLRMSIRLTGQGRTDAGVHARQMVAHFDFEDELPFDLSARLNQLLPPDIRIDRIHEVSPDAHARYSAQYRVYRYYIHRNPDPFLVDRSWLIHALPYPELLNPAAQMLLKQTDFGCFAKTHGGNQTNECKVERAEWVIDSHQLIFTIQADRFLRQMVRAIVGSLMVIAQGRKSVDWWVELLSDSPKRKCGLAAPPQGLFLEEVAYPVSICLDRIPDSVVPSTQI